MLLLFQFLFNLPHFLTHSLVGTHSQTLAQKFDSENSEKESSREMSEPFRDESWYRMT
jgi:hypothetical protein